MSEAADSVVGRPVTIFVARRVHPGMEVEFEDWAEELTRAASEFHGFLGAGLLRPGHLGDDWHVVYRFSTPEALADWESSSVRAKLLAKGEQVMSTATSTESAASRLGSNCPAVLRRLLRGGRCSSSPLWSFSC
jgi:antibiotic biosynthesis monooxygenase (ABM) superfamily enzyme